MGTLITVSQFLLALSILIILHELGHFLAARFFGIKVEKFYLFFDAWGIKLFKFRKGDTEYGIGWLPLGGYVKIAGMVDESLDTEQLKTEPQQWEFRGKPAWQRLIIMVGGVVVNLLLGIFIFWMMTWSQGEKYVPTQAVNESGGIYAGPLGRKIGFQTGDKIIAFNGKPSENFLEEFANPDFIMGAKHEIQINRNGKDTTLILPSKLEEVLAEKSDLPIISPRFNFKIASVVEGTPAAKAGLAKEDIIVAIDSQKVAGFLDFKEIIQQKKNKNILLTVLKDKATETDNVSLKVEADGTIGFKPILFGFEEKEKVINYGFFESAGMGAKKAFSFLAANAMGFGKMLSGDIDPRKSLAGPVGMAQMYGSTWDWINFWGLTAMISLGLAFLNILPIPALDGGHVMFLLWEMITRKPVSDKALYIGQVIGMVILGSLMIFIFWVDIARALGF
ncbi:MAG: RIP metalloprotease RseP [Sphingomonadales bacterium]|nr:RIP metalloprotease RseP [Sphingomonadales bacterium]